MRKRLDCVNHETPDAVRRAISFGKKILCNTVVFLCSGTWGFGKNHACMDEPKSMSVA